MYDEQEKQEILEYLDDLRASGRANMFTEARAFMIRELDITREEARELHTLWMETFAERHGG